ncbi:DegT/DnrJ/EryC1/StrS family aminotransferase [candidate division KSB1 bacterium]|nr:DegT/DnrJ/EryC1/StrS family aminotransferase [candidate division KSB1 bacterium]
MSKLAILGGEPVRTRPFPTWPVHDQDELNGLIDVLKSNEWGSTKGQRVKQFEQHYAEYHDAKYGICVNSGTTALYLALKAAGIGCGDEVLLPGYTFIATATSIIDTGAVPVFVDIDPDTYNIDPAQIEEKITDKTRAIMPVHFAGRPADMTALLAIADKYDLKIIEDAAQAWGSEWNGRKVGAIGTAGCFSFQSSKNITAGEGGIILSNDEETAQFARSYSNCGRLANGVWYEHYYLGGNYRMTEFQAALLQAQFNRYPQLKAIRDKNALLLDAHLSRIEGVKTMKNDPRVTSNSRHIYIWRYQKEAFNNVPKDKFINAMRKEGMYISPGYSIPLTVQPVLKNLAFGPRGKRVDIGIDYASVSLPETEKACYDEAIWFTQNVLLGTEEDMLDIVKAIVKIQENSKDLVK